MHIADGKYIALLTIRTDNRCVCVSLSACLRRPSPLPLLLFTTAARSWKLRIWRWGVAWRTGGSRSGNAAGRCRCLGEQDSSALTAGAAPPRPPHCGAPPLRDSTRARLAAPAAPAWLPHGAAAPPLRGPARARLAAPVVPAGLPRGAAAPPLRIRREPRLQEGWTRCYAEEGRTARANQLSHILA